MEIKFATPTFHIVGDGTSASVELSVLEYPFVGAPKARPTAATVTDGGDHITDASIEGSIIVLTFDAAFSGDNGGSILTLTFPIGAN